MVIIRTHRVGSITAGLSLIAFGVMFMIHLFTNIITYDMIFKLWPMILIGLGAELLMTNFAKDEMIYDKAAIALMIVMAFFAMGMACADWIFVSFQGGI